MLLPDVLRLFACGWRLPNATEGCYLPCLPTSMACAKGCRQQVDVAHVEVNVRPTVITLAIISAAFSPLAFRLWPFAFRRRCYDEYLTYVPPCAPDSTRNALAVRLKMGLWEVLLCIISSNQASP